MLSIKKTTVNKQLREEFTEVLENDILKPTKINLVGILKKYDNIGINIENSLSSGETTYTIPKNVELFEGYKAPDTIEPVRAVIAWNALEPEDMIIPPEKINIIKLRSELLDCFLTLTSVSQIDSIRTRQFMPENITKEALELIDTYPEKAKTIARVIYNIEGNNKINISRFGLSIIALPKSATTIPEYIKPFIDYKNMVNLNITNGYILLESLGVYVETNAASGKSYKSNIISI